MVSQRQFRAIVPQIYGLFARGSHNTGLADGVLLRRYCAGGDESAFECLVARHGPMVLGVCHGILRDESTAEDAFQVVFLILVRKAGTIRVEDSLGGWLHGVAYKVARRAQTDLRNRRTREGTRCADLDAEAPREGAADPRLASLHEEISRLPETHRQAVVSCWLEGKTQIEAAQELGCGEATVRRRLARARERLRTRLRGDSPDAFAPMTLLAIPPRLLEATAHAVRAPLSSLAREVLREMARIQGMKAVASLLVVGLMVLGVAFAMGGQPGSEPAPQAPAAPPAIRHPAAPPAAKLPPVQGPPAPDRKDWGTVKLSVRVVDPEGEPVAGAKVFKPERRWVPPPQKGTTDAEGRLTFTTPRELGPWRAEGSSDRVSQTTILPDGSRITITDQSRAHTDTEEVKHIKPWLIATAPGYGFGTFAPGAEVTLKLAPDVPVTGRVVDEAGQPVAGARVRVRDVLWPWQPATPEEALEFRRRRAANPAIPDGEGLDPWLTMVRKSANINEYRQAEKGLAHPVRWKTLGDKASVFIPVIPAVTTDADGRFVLRGIGAERVAEVCIDGGPSQASSLIVVVTRPLEKPILIVDEPRDETAGAGRFVRDLMVYGMSFETKLAPGRAIEGHVLEGVSRLPVPHARVVGLPTTKLEFPGFDRFSATTDELGHYRIDGFPVTSESRLYVQAPSESPLFDQSMNREITPGPVPLRVDFPLARGVWITGRVVDADTGQGLPNEYVDYLTFQDNPHLRKDLDAGFSPQVGSDHQTERTGKGGTFRIRGYRGRGIVMAGDGNAYLKGIGTNAIKGLEHNLYVTSRDRPDRFDPALRNTTIELNIPDNARTFECEVRLKKEEKIQATR